MLNETQPSRSTPHSHPESLRKVGGVGRIEEIQESFLLHKGWCVTHMVTVKDMAKWAWSKNVWASINRSMPLQTCAPMQTEHVWTQRALIQRDPSQRIETDYTYWLQTGRQWREEILLRLTGNTCLLHFCKTQKMHIYVWITCWTLEAVKQLLFLFTQSMIYRARALIKKA